MRPLQFGALPAAAEQLFTKPRSRSKIELHFEALSCGFFSKGKATKFIRTRGFSKLTRFRNTENLVNPLFWTWTWLKHFRSHHKSASRTKRFTTPIFLLNSEVLSGLRKQAKVKPWLPNKVRKPARFCDAMVGPLLIKSRYVYFPKLSKLKESGKFGKSGRFALLWGGCFPNCHPPCTTQPHPPPPPKKKGNNWEVCKR